jgi:hypothetical protein
VFKWVLWAAVITGLFSLAFLSQEMVDENKLKEDYYEVIVVVSDLFKDHTQVGEQYYNRSYHSEEEIGKLLEGRVTENGFHLVVDSFFDEYDDLFVYRQQYQEYLSDTLDFTLRSKRNNYYETVKDSILNPALRLIPFEQLEINQQENKIIVKGDNIRVKFYEERDQQSHHHQLARYGYPSSDRISLTLTFINDNGIYLLDDFVVSSHGK